MRTKVFRPFLDDVERLSYGQGAKKQRGTGSRFVCHRLNRDERKLYDLAKQAGYLTVRGTGYRKERKGSPVCNTFRQRCDALEEICVIVEKRADTDTLIIDFSTLRVRDDTQFVSLILENVLKAKYPDLYSATKNCDDDSCSIIQKPIIWDAVKTKPIWCVNERLITLNCARDVAKSLAIDVLKESMKFDANVVESIIETMPDHNDDVNSKSEDSEFDAIIVERITETVPDRNDDTNSKSEDSEFDAIIAERIIETVPDCNDDTNSKSDDSSVDFDDI